MSYHEADLVKIASPPPNQENLVGDVGFVNINPTSDQVEVAILDLTGLRDIYIIPESCLVSSNTPETKILYHNYRDTLKVIKREAEERQRKRTNITNYLARKYNIAPDEVHGIYKAMLHYEEYHEEYIRRV